MESAALVDSSFFIRHQRLGRDAFVDLERWSARYDLLTCGMVTLEVLRGARTEAALKLYRIAFAVMNCIPTTTRVWDRATDLAWALERKGTPIPAPDSLIAAHALQARAAVLTLDRDFRRIPGLMVLDSLA
jgi:predicted nucleic acid-binding protein